MKGSRVFTYIPLLVLVSRFGASFDFRFIAKGRQRCKVLTR